MTALAFATELRLNPAESQPVQSNQDKNNYGQQQMLNGQYIKMGVKGASMIGGLVSTVIH